MWEIIAVLLLVTPLVTTTFDYLVYHELLSATGPESDSVGFSGIGSAFAGLLLASIGYYTKSQVTDEAGYNLMYSVYLISAAILIALHTVPALVAVAGYSLVIIGLSIGIKSTIDSLGTSSPTQIASGIADNFRDFALIVLAVAVIFLTVFAMFPGQYGTGDRATNILAHFIGMAWGFIVAVLLIRFRRFS